MISTFIIIVVICVLGLGYLALIHFYWLRESPGDVTTDAHIEEPPGTGRRTSGGEQPSQTQLLAGLGKGVQERL